MSLGDSVEKLVSHSMEVLGVAQADIEGIKMLSGAPLLQLSGEYDGEYSRIPTKAIGHQ